MDDDTHPRLSRRGFLGGALAAATAVGAGAGTAACGTGGSARRPATAHRGPGSRPFAHLPAGRDTMPEIEHVVVCMLENHSFDNMLGVLGRGDGFTLGADGRPADSNPYQGRTLRAFHMPSPCQLRSQPFNTWDAGHVSDAGGTCRGFADSQSGPVAMGYFDETDLPFTYALARAFPISDRYFSSVMAQTFPNRRFLLAGTSLGLVEDSLPPELPPNGVIFQQFERLGISWRNYHASLPTLGVFLPLLGDAGLTANLAGIDRFFADAAAGTLPAFSLVDPDFGTESQENPQDVRAGDAFLARVVHALVSSPAWPKVLFVWCYDEGGGYYDHVPPPAAVAPDGVRPDITVPPSQPGGFDRYGFRVPMGVVSPYARHGHVSHVVADHTSILKLVETKWNLPALTRRDANASDLLDMVDLRAAPAFLHPPALPAAYDPAALAPCTPGDPGVIPPPDALTG